MPMWVMFAIFAGLASLMFLGVFLFNLWARRQPRTAGLNGPVFVDDSLPLDHPHHPWRHQAMVGPADLSATDTACHTPSAGNFDAPSAGATDCGGAADAGSGNN